LELLQETGLREQGVDRSRILVEQCQRRGLGVVESDVLTYLRNFPDASLHAVTGFHTLEHWPLEVLMKLLDETVRVLTSGGVAIFETPHPQNAPVGSHNFYLDPTHRHPLPSAIIKFMAEHRGLYRVQICALHSYPRRFVCRKPMSTSRSVLTRIFTGPKTMRWWGGKHESYCYTGPVHHEGRCRQQ
jgi:SAM-dependent methyltransferase